MINREQISGRLLSKRNRRLAAFCIIGLLCLFLTTACSSNGEMNQDSQSSMDRESAEHIIITVQTLENSRMEDLDLVIEAVNNITVPEIGVFVDVRLVDAIDAFSQYPLWISNGESIDLMILNYQDITTYIGKGMLIPLDDLLQEYGADIRYIMETDGYMLTEGSIVKGEAYGVANVPAAVGGGGGIWVPERVLEEGGLSYDKNHIYSLDELTEYFSAWKTLYPEKYPLGQITSGNAYSTLPYYVKNMDSLGGDMITGVLIEEGSTEIVNLFESDNYYEYLEYLRKWYLAGYIYPDAAITDTGIIEFIKSGVVMSYPLSSIPGMGMDEAFGENIVCMRTTEVMNSAQYSKSGFWVIPITSNSPEAAMKFLNMMFLDTRICNLISWGIEGEHYVIADEESGMITYPEGLSSSTVGYLNPMGLYGDYRKSYFQGFPKLREEYQEYSSEALNNPFGIRGIVYSTENVNKQILAVQKVVEKYVPILESGSVDLDVYYPVFIKELKTAGMDEIIIDKQRQLDEWLAGEAEY